MIRVSCSINEISAVATIGRELEAVLSSSCKIGDIEGHIKLPKIVEINLEGTTRTFNNQTNFYKT